MMPRMAVLALAGVFAAALAPVQAQEYYKMDKPDAAQMCDQRIPEACARLVALHKEGQVTSSELVTARSVLKTACYGDKVSLCDSYGYLLRYGLGGPKDLAGAEQAYVKHCDNWKEIAPILEMFSKSFGNEPGLVSDECTDLESLRAERASLRRAETAARQKAEAEKRRQQEAQRPKTAPKPATGSSSGSTASAKKCFKLVRETRPDLIGVDEWGNVYTKGSASYQKVYRNTCSTPQVITIGEKNYSNHYSTEYLLAWNKPVDVTVAPGETVVAYCTAYTAENVFGSRETVAVMCQP